MPVLKALAHRGYGALVAPAGDLHQNLQRQAADVRVRVVQLLAHLGEGAFGAPPGHLGQRAGSCGPHRLVGVLQAAAQLADRAGAYNITYYNSIDNNIQYHYTICYIIT